MAESDLVTYYKLRAQEYDKVYERPERQADIRALASLLRPAVTGRRVLELAAGTGYWTPIIAAVAEARDYAGGRAEFRIADAYEPQAVAGEFDCVVAGYFLSHVPRDRVVPFLDSVVDRVGRGGRVVLLDNCTSMTATSRSLARMRTATPTKPDSSTTASNLRCSRTSTTATNWTSWPGLMRPRSTSSC